MLVTLSGPSGSGKTTLIRGLQAACNARPLASYTTRHRRKSEREFTEQTFLSRGEFDELEARGEFLWTDQPYGRPYRYGTRAEDVRKALASDALYTPPLTLKALPALWEYAQRHLMPLRVWFFYFYIEDLVELRRRIVADRPDAERADLIARLSSVHKENKLARKLTEIPLRHLDATLSKEKILAQALRILRDANLIDPSST